LKTALYAPLTVRANSCDTVYPRHVVCFRYISVNTLHKGNDDDYDDDDNNNNKRLCYVFAYAYLAGQYV
jgi:hypothetical protein